MAPLAQLLMIFQLLAFSRLLSPPLALLRSINTKTDDFVTVNTHALALKIRKIDQKKWALWAGSLATTKGDEWEVEELNSVRISVWEADIPPPGIGIAGDGKACFVVGMETVFYFDQGKKKFNSFADYRGTRFFKVLDQTSTIIYPLQAEDNINSISFVTMNNEGYSKFGKKNLYSTDKSKQRMLSSMMSIGSQFFFAIMENDYAAADITRIDNPPISGKVKLKIVMWSQLEAIQNCHIGTQVSPDTKVGLYTSTDSLIIHGYYDVGASRQRDSIRVSAVPNSRHVIIASVSTSLTIVPISETLQYLTDKLIVMNLMADFVGVTSEFNIILRKDDGFYRFSPGTVIIKDSCSSECTQEGCYLSADSTACVACSGEMVGGVCKKKVATSTPLSISTIEKRTTSTPFFDYLGAVERSPGHYFDNGTLPKSLEELLSTYSNLTTFNNTDIIKSQLSTAAITLLIVCIVCCLIICLSFCCCIYCVYLSDTAKPNSHKPLVLVGDQSFGAGFTGSPSQGYPQPQDSSLVGYTAGQTYNTPGLMNYEVNQQMITPSSTFANQQHPQHQQF